LNTLPAPNNRVLLVDDQQQIHEDYGKILALGDLAPEGYDALAADFFGDDAPDKASGGTAAGHPEFDLTSAHQGLQAVELVRAACAEGSPFAMAFVDVRMPPGIDGIETIERVREIDNEIQIVIATAYADYAWEDIQNRFGVNDFLLFLRKPFDAVEVNQLASNQVRKWHLARQARLKMEELEAQVVVRTRELSAAMAELTAAQGQIVQSEKMAALGKLVAGLAHELNTPLGTLASSTDVVVRSRKILNELCGGGGDLAEIRTDARFQRAMRAMEQSLETTASAAGRIDELVSGLRAFSLLDQAEFQHTDVNAGLEATLTVLNHEIPAEVKVVRDFGDVPRVLGYPAQLNQLFLGLLRRAVAEIDPPGTITVTTESVDDQVRISIRDDGRGCDEAELKRIFDPGFKADAQRVRMDWGLVTCSRIVEMHQGSIAAKSAPGQGSTFTLVIPVNSGPPQC